MSPFPRNPSAGRDRPDAPFCPPETLPVPIRIPSRRRRRTAGPTLEPLFVTEIYRAELGAALVEDVARAAALLAREDTAGIAWCRRKGYAGYTSYASLDDLPWRFPAFATLARHITRHARRYADALDHDLGGKPLVLDDLWVNVLAPGGMHGSHLHPNAVISGTFYVAVPPGARALKLEDPRLGFLMAAPPKHRTAPRHRQTFVEVRPSPGTLLMWESFLRHEVPPNGGATERVSVSFNLRWG
jgi:uncharacterized protein (TIGR02466 family)